MHVFELTGGELCLDFANTIDNRADPARRQDHLRAYVDLLSWAEQSRTLAAAESSTLGQIANRRPQVASRAVSRARHLREAIYDVFSAQAAGRRVPRASVDLIGREAALASAHRRIISNGRASFSWIWEPSAEHIDLPLWPVALSAADVLTSDRVTFVRECALETCGWLFLDTSRNQTRRWCDMRVCGNRAKVRRFYERARSQRNG
jgi:predicted RNA-binding Zn ribbon-like protein